MKQKIILIIAILLSLTCTSCFEILEEMQLNANGSGQYTIIVNLSESKTKLNTIMALDSVQGYKVPKKTDITKQMATIKGKISNLPGISNVQSTFDPNEFIGTIKFDFTDVQQINMAMKLVMDQYKVKNYSIPTYFFDRVNRQLVRNYKTQTNTLTQYNKLKQEDKDVLQKAKYTSIYKFGNEIKASENKAAKLAKNNKALFQQAPLHPIINNQVNINQRITLQP